MLLLGRDGDDPLFLQFKEAQASVLEPFLGASEFANHGQRVVEGQRLMQAASDIMLGWIRHRRRRRRRARLLRPPAVGREGLGDRRADGADGDDDVRAGLRVGRSRVRTRARATRIAIASYLGTSDAFDRALATFAEAYADQNERDYEALQAAVASGRVEAAVGM